MAKDDYHVIVYKILAYLYAQLKAGKPVDEGMITEHGKLFCIEKSYWQFILETLYSEGYVTGATKKAWGVEEVFILSDMRITPKGIEYLADNAFLQKVKRFLKEAGDIITPFI